MNKLSKNNLGSKISKWQNNFMERHPAFFYLITEIIAEVIIACILAVSAFNMLPPELEYKVYKKTPTSSVLSITNEGLLYAEGEYGIKTKKPLVKNPEVLIGKQYVDSLERRTKDSFGLELSGLPYKKHIKIEFKSDNIAVNEE